MIPQSSKAQVAEAYRQLSLQGLNVGSAGNVSARSGERMLITRSGASEAVTPEDIIDTGFDGRFEGPDEPSSEWAMHAAIYAAVPLAQAVVHTHSDACTALACLGEDLPPFHYMVLGFGGADVRCAPYSTFGSPELAASAVQALEGRTACLLANHGMICHGPSLASAVDAAQRLETLVRQYLLARSAGAPRLLTPAEIEDARQRYKSYGGRGA